MARTNLNVENGNGFNEYVFLYLSEIPWLRTRVH